MGFILGLLLEDILYSTGSLSLVSFTSFYVLLWKQANSFSSRYSDRLVRSRTHLLSQRIFIILYNISFAKVSSRLGRVC